MNNLLMKELKLGVNPFFYFMPILTGALMLIPGWLYFLVPLYFCFITIPNIFAGYKTQNDLQFSIMLPVNKKDIVKAKVGVVLILELIHIIIAVIFGAISVRLYPNFIYYFYSPTVGFWGLCFVMYGIFNLTFISLFYKTAYKYGVATIVSTTCAVLFAFGAEWIGIKNPVIFTLFKESSADNNVTHLLILIIGLFIFLLFTFIAYMLSVKRFEKVEI